MGCRIYHTWLFTKRFLSNSVLENEEKLNWQMDTSHPWTCLIYPSWVFAIKLCKTRRKKPTCCSYFLLHSGRRILWAAEMIPLNGTDVLNSSPIDTFVQIALGVPEIPAAQWHHLSLHETIYSHKAWSRNSELPISTLPMCIKILSWNWTNAFKKRLLFTYFRLYKLQRCL